MTSYQRVNPELPEAEQHRLQTLRESPSLEDARRLRARVLALRDRGWPLRAIADPLQVSRMSVQMWDRRGRRDTELVSASQVVEVPGLPILSRGTGYIAKRVPVDVPEPERERLRELSALAKKVRAGTPPESKEKQASNELDQLVLKYRKRGVTSMAIARHAGVTRRAIAARLERLDAQDKVDA